MATAGCRPFQSVLLKVQFWPLPYTMPIAASPAMTILHDGLMGLARMGTAVTGALSELRIRPEEDGVIAIGRIGVTPLHRDQL